MAEAQSKAERRAVGHKTGKAARGQNLPDLKDMIRVLVFFLRTEEIHGRIYLWKSSWLLLGTKQPMEGGRVDVGRG